MLKNKNNFEMINSVFSLLGRELFRPPLYDACFLIYLMTLLQLCMFMM